MTDLGPEDPSDTDVASHLYWSLLDYYHEQEALFPDVSASDEMQLRDAMNEINDHSLDLVTTGRFPQDLEDRLSSYQPGASLENKLLDLLGHDRVRERIEFDVAFEVVGRLDKVEHRVLVATVAFALLLRADPSETAVKYFRTAARLYLAGYEAEVSIMCGAVLEAAIAVRIPDETLNGARIRPRNRGSYSIGQRMEYETQHSFLSDEQRKEFWRIVNWRNDAVHVQLDMGPTAGLPLLLTANLLGRILPRDIPL